LRKSGFSHEWGAVAAIKREPRMETSRRRTIVYRGVSKSHNMILTWTNAAGVDATPLSIT
jgi:hypothetical protein